MSSFTAANIPSQNGKLAIITGANSGIGYETALELARAGAEIVLAGRSEPKGIEAVQRILREIPSAKVRFGKADLASLASVKGFAEQMLSEDRPIDLLINNAGVMMPPKRKTTADGFELQFGTNHLGHFALTGQLLPLLRRASRPRVVNVSSLAHRSGKIRFEDLQWEQGYKPWPSYGQSKLANLLFTFELQRKSDAEGWGLMSDAAAPGWARTELVANGPGAHSFMARVSGILAPFLSHSAAAGALSTLFAATSTEARPTGFYEPKDFLGMKGYTAPARTAPAALDVASAQRLWAVSEALTGVRWPQN